MQKFHFGLVNVSDGKCRPQPARLKVCPDLLVLQREEIIFPDDDDTYPTDNKVRSLYFVSKLDLVGSLNLDKASLYLTYDMRGGSFVSAWD